MQQLSKQIKTLVNSCESKAFDLKAHMIKVETVQSAVAQLLERIEDIQHKGWDKDKGMAYLAIGEIEQTVRLIDMAFYPLFNEMNDTVDKLHNDSVQLLEGVHANEKNKKADAPTSTNENNL